MELGAAVDFARQRHQGVLATQRRDGRPQMSNIAYLLGDDGTIRISVTESRAKTKNLERDPRASLYVLGDDFWSYCVLDCDTELMPVAKEPDDPTVSALVEYYRALSGEHPDWDEYRQAMIHDRRLMLVLTPTHAYGMLT
jgi:PPOX class probable F420-dependent enzyme